MLFYCFFDEKKRTAFESLVDLILLSLVSIDLCSYGSESKERCTPRLLLIYLRG